MQYRLRTLLILSAIGPPLMASAWWVCLSVAQIPDVDLIVHILLGLGLYAAYIAAIVLYAFGCIGTSRIGDADQRRLLQVAALATTAVVALVLLVAMLIMI